MRLRDIRYPSDLKDMNGSDVVSLLDELRAIARHRGTEILQQGRVQARRAIGVPTPAAVGWWFVLGVALGSMVGAIVAALMTPMPGREARQRLAQQADQLKERMPEMRVGANGRHRYPAMDLSEPPMPTSTARPMA
jgi:hypothetical protein